MNFSNWACVYLAYCVYGSIKKVPDVSPFQDRVGMLADHLLLQVVEHTHPQQHPEMEEKRF